MLRLRHLALFAVVLLVACDDANSPTSETKSADRPISAALRRSCPVPTASRAMVDTVNGVEIRLAPRAWLSGSIFDSLGKRRARIEQEILVRDSMVTGPVFFAWNGLDSTGARCPAGPYFVFTEIRDSLGALLAKDSSCLYWQTGSGT